MERLLIAGWAFSGGLWALQVYAHTGTSLALVYIACAAIAVLGNIVAAIVEWKS